MTRVKARKDALGQSGGAAPYKPLPPERLYLTEGEWRERLQHAALARLTSFAAPEQSDVIEVGAHACHNFTAERATPGANVFEAVTKHVQALQSAGKRAAIALWSDGSRERMAHVLAEHGLHNLAPVASWPQALALPRQRRAVKACPPLGFGEIEPVRRQRLVWGAAIVAIERCASRFKIVRDLRKPLVRGFFG